MMTSALPVLYVDDEPDLLDIGKLFLEGSRDFTVTTALSAPEGIRLLEQEKFDAIISDYQMPGMDGIQFLVEVRKRFGPVPFILFTGRGREEIVIQALNSGADFYLQKGGEAEAQFAELTHKVKSAIKQYSSENALQKSEAQFRAISENSQDFIRRYDKEHRHTYANPACLRTAGKTAEQFIGKTHHELGFPPDLCAIWEPAIDKVFATGQPYRETFAWTGVDGEAILDWRLFPEKDDKGNVVTVLGVSRDITAIKTVEKSLREARKRTVTVLEDIADTFYSLDDKWRFVIVNPAAEKAPFKRPASELLGRVIWDLYPGLVGTIIQQHYFNAAKNFTLEHFEGLSPLNGRWYEVFMQGWRGGVDVHMRDITERMQAVDALQESQDRFARSETDLQIQQTEIEMQAEELRRTNLALEDSRDHYLDLYEFAPIGYFMLNDKALITGANLTGAILLGVDRSKLVKAPLSKFIAEKDTDEWHRYFRNVLKHEEKQTCTLMFTRGDGSTFPVQLESIRITYRDATQTVRVAISDITERKRAEEALRTSEEKYRKAFLTSLDSICITRMSDGMIVSANKGFTDMTGYTEDEAVGKTSLEINLWKDPKDRRKIVEGLKAKGEVRDYEAHLLTKNGEIYGSMSASVIELNGVPHILNITRDISGRKLTEDKMQEAGQRRLM